MKTELIENIEAKLTNKQKVFPIAKVNYFEIPQNDSLIKDQTPELNWLLR